MVMNKLPAQQALELLDRDIAEEESRLASQAAAIARLAKEGRDTTLAEGLMGSLEAQLNALRAHREVIAFQHRIRAPESAFS